MITRRLIILSSIAAASLAIGIFVASHFRSIATGNALLELKHQLQKPDDYFRISPGETYVIDFKSPIVTREMVNKLGIWPTREETRGATTIWHAEFVRQADAPGKLATCDIGFEFKDDRLQRLTLPKTFGAFLDARLLAQYAAIIGYAKVDFLHRRSAPDPDAPKLPRQAYSFPDASDCLALFGPPLKTETFPNQTCLQYRLTQYFGPKGLRPVDTSLFFRRGTGAFRFGRFSIAGFVVEFGESNIVVRKS